MRLFPPSPIAALVDDTPLYNLGESYCRELTVEELLGADGVAALTRLTLGYSTSPGAPELRQLIAGSTGVAPGEVLVTTGAASALFLLGLLFGDSAGEIVVVRPCFPPMLDALRGVGARVVTVGLRFEDGYRLDVARVAGALSASTRLVMIASPQNPAGVTSGRADVERLLDDMARACPGALLLIDETFRDSAYGDAPAPDSFASLSPRVLTCASLSKSHGAPGLRIGWLTARHPDLYEQLRLAKFNMSVSCGALDEYLATVLLRKAAEVVAPRRAFLAQALAVVEGWVRGHRGGIRWVRPDGGAFCCVQLDPDVHSTDDVKRFHARLAERRVLVAAGEWFGDSGHVFRLGFGYEPLEKLQAGLTLIDEALTA
jgi:aspartate/methionine/tyrosine aminotransferase